MFSSYGSLRSQYPTTAFTVAAVAGGNLPTSGTINIRVAGRNRAGFNLLSNAQTVTYQPGQRLIITLSSELWKSGEDLFEIAICGETTGKPEDAQLLATWVAREADQVSPRQLPATVTINNLTGTKFSYISDTTQEGGCDSLICTIPPPPYQGGEFESTAVTYWVNNGLSEASGVTLRTGTGINLQVLLNDQATNNFINRIILDILGYVRRTTGELTPVESNGKFAWDGDPIPLPQDLEPGYALAISVSLLYKPAEVQISRGSKLEIQFNTAGVTGKKQSSGYFLGDIIYPVGQKLRIVPERSGSFRRLGGIAVIKSWETPELGDAIFSGLAPNTSGQRLAISGALGGDIRVLVAAEEPRSTEAIRAIISTAAGQFTPSSWSGDVVLSTPGAIQVTIDYPCDQSGRGIIRADYPDVIASLNTAAFNPPYIKPFLLSGSTIYALPTLITVLPQPSQTFVLNNLEGAIALDNLPTTPSADFCLFGYGAISATPITDFGSIPAGTYKVALAYHFPPDSSEITSISHSDARCIAELTGTISDLFKGQQALDDAIIYSLIL
jgi:hypothetical protein